MNPNPNFLLDIMKLMFPKIQNVPSFIGDTVTPTTPLSDGDYVRSHQPSNIMIAAEITDTLEMKVVNSKQRYQPE